MKRVFATILIMILLCTSFVFLQGCNQKSIDLTVDNICDYITINVIQNEIQSQVGNKNLYYKYIHIITNSKIDAKYRNLKITFDLETSDSGWDSQSDKSIEVSYTGESETQFHVSAVHPVSSTPEYKVIITRVDGQIIIK